MDELLAHLDPGAAPTAEIFNAVVDVVNSFITFLGVLDDRVALLEEAVFGDDQPPPMVNVAGPDTYQGAER